MLRAARKWLSVATSDISGNRNVTHSRPQLETMLDVLRRFRERDRASQVRCRGSVAGTARFELHPEMARGIAM